MGKYFQITCTLRENTVHRLITYLSPFLGGLIGSKKTSCNDKPSNGVLSRHLQTNNRTLFRLHGILLYHTMVVAWRTGSAPYM